MRGGNGGLTEEAVRRAGAERRRRNGVLRSATSYDGRRRGGVVGAWSTGKLRGVRHGGNLGGNLGEVELTVRLRRRQWRLQNLCDFAEGGGWLWCSGAVGGVADE
jgi:hypothetical protein